MAALAVRPSNVTVRYVLSRVLLAQGRAGEAAAHCQRAVELDPRRTPPLLAREGTGEARSLDRAGASYRHAVQLDPKFANAYFYLGFILNSQRQFPEAVTAFQRYVELDPTLAPAHIGLGFALCESGKFTESLAAYHHAIDIDPISAGAYYGVGNILLRQQKFEEAIVLYQQALEINPNHADAYQSLGQALGKQKRLDEAVRAFERAIAIDPRKEFHHDLGMCCGFRGNCPKRSPLTRRPSTSTPHSRGLTRALAWPARPEQAGRCGRGHQGGRELDPNNADYRYSLANLLKQQNKLDEAVAQYKKATDIDPRHPLAYAALGDTLLRQNKPAEAIASGKKAIDINPKNAKATTSLRSPTSDRTNWARRSIGYKQAVDIDPNNADFRHNLALAYVADKKLDEAIDAFREVVRLRPTDAAHYELGITLMRREKVDAAILRVSRKPSVRSRTVPGLTTTSALLTNVREALNDAITAYRNAIRYQEHHLKARYNLGHALARTATGTAPSPRTRRRHPIQAGLRRGAHQSGSRAHTQGAVPGRHAAAARGHSAQAEGPGRPQQSRPGY